MSEKEREAVRELSDAELDHVTGGKQTPPHNPPHTTPGHTGNTV